MDENTSISVTVTNDMPCKKFLYKQRPEVRGRITSYPGLALNVKIRLLVSFSYLDLIQISGHMKLLSKKLSVSRVHPARSRKRAGAVGKCKRAGSSRADFTKKEKTILKI